MQRAELVAVRVAQIRQVQLAYPVIAKARGLFARGAAVGDACRMEGVGLLGGLHGEPDGAAIAVSGGLAIDGRGDAEAARGAAIEIPVPVGNPRANTQRAEQRVVKLLGNLKVVDTEHDVTEHGFLRWGPVVGEVEFGGWYLMGGQRWTSHQADL